MIRFLLKMISKIQLEIKNPLHLAKYVIRTFYRKIEFSSKAL